jgi:methyl-accepting chemotaxis protein
MLAMAQLDVEYVRGLLRLYVARKGHGAISVVAEATMEGDEPLTRQTVSRFHGGRDAEEGTVRRVYEALAKLGAVGLNDATQAGGSVLKWMDAPGEPSQRPEQEESAVVSRVSIELPYQRILEDIRQASAVGDQESVNKLLDLSWQLDQLNETIEGINEELGAFSENLSDVEHQVKQKLTAIRRPKSNSDSEPKRDPDLGLIGRPKK